MDHNSDEHREITFQTVREELQKLETKLGSANLRDNQRSIIHIMPLNNINQKLTVLINEN